MASKLDPAAQNIARDLTKSHGFHADPDPTSDLLRSGDVLLKHVQTDSIHTDSMGIKTSVDAVIFASRHKSETNEPTLTVHWTGNTTSSADFGGKPKSLSYADPPRLRAALLALDAARESRRLDYKVTMEATHHGPTELGVPTLFVEIGSTEREWNDPVAASCVSEAIWKAATSPLEGRNAVGFGGGHYCGKQTIAVRKDGFAFGHVVSKYFFEEYDEEMVRMAFERSKVNCKSAVIDWKGMKGSQRSKLLETLKKMEKEIIRV